MKPHALRRRTALGAAALALAGLAASGVALASTPATPHTNAAVAGPQVYFGYHAGSVFVQYSTMKAIAHLALPAGTYTVSGKAWVESNAGAGSSAVYCKLSMGSNTDFGQVDAQDGHRDQPIRHEILYLTFSGTITVARSAWLDCGNYGGGYTVLRNISITATRLGALSKTNI